MARTGAAIATLVALGLILTLAGVALRSFARARRARL
jgi:hypothetical protein